MATGLCTAAVTLTAEEITRLEELPDAANLVEEADACQFSGGHAGRHAYLAQVQDSGAEALVYWWIVWDGPAQPDSKGYEIVPVPLCEARRGLDECRHPDAHENEHRFD